VFIADGTTGPDAELALAVETASRSIDFACNRQFGSVDEPESRLYSAYWDKSLRRGVIEIDDLMTATGLIVETETRPGEFSAITDYLPHPCQRCAERETVDEAGRRCHRVCVAGRNRG
jgi:hypothetical protein